jgi:hypothetical protein
MKNIITIGGVGFLSNTDLIFDLKKDGNILKGFMDPRIKLQKKKISKSLSRKFVLSHSWISLTSVGLRVSSK